MALTLLVPFAARAGEPDDFAAPIPITSPYHKPMVFQGDGPNPLPATAWTVFANFDGGKMKSCGWDNSPQDNCSTIFQGTVLPFSGNAAQRAAVVQVIRADLGQFNINVVDKRPESGDYDMEMIGDWNPAPQGGFAGVAPSLDCWNDNGGEVSFTLDYTGTATGIAKAVLQEIAHTWGLEHVDSKSDLLYPTTQSVPDPTFQDVCNPIVRLDDKGNTVPENCECCQQHAQFCGQNQQNSYRELLQLFGPGQPDLTAPTLAITAPMDGEEVEPSFELAMHVEDNQSPQLLIVDIAVEGPDSFMADPTSWASPSDLTFPISGVKPGEYTITAKVVDEYDNEAVDVVTFTVKGPPPETSTTSTTTTEGTTESPTTGEPATTGEPETTAAPGDDTGVPDPTSGPATGGGGDDGDESCNCRTDAVPGASGLLLLLGLFGARRRARR